MITTIIDILTRHTRKILIPECYTQAVCDSVPGGAVRSGFQAFSARQTGSGNSLCNVESYRFGRITIAGEVYDDDVMVFPERVREEWWRQKGHSVCREDIEEILEYEPEMVIFGTGATGRMDVPDEIKNLLEEQGIKFFQDITSEATERFNKELDKGKKVVGAFHLTC